MVRAHQLLQASSISMIADAETQGENNPDTLVSTLPYLFASSLSLQL